MLFFYKKSYSSNEQRMPWLPITIVLSLAAIVSTSAIAYVPMDYPQGQYDTT